MDRGGMGHGPGGMGPGPGMDRGGGMGGPPGMGPPGMGPPPGMGGPGGMGPPPHMMDIGGSLPSNLLPASCLEACVCGRECARGADKAATDRHGPASARSLRRRAPGRRALPGASTGELRRRPRHGRACADRPPWPWRWLPRCPVCMLLACQLDIYAFASMSRACVWCGEGRGRPQAAARVGCGCRDARACVQAWDRRRAWEAWEAGGRTVAWARRHPAAHPRSWPT